LHLLCEDEGEFNILDRGFLVCPTSVCGRFFTTAKIASLMTDEKRARYPWRSGAEGQKMICAHRHNKDMTLSMLRRCQDTQRLRHVKRRRRDDDDKDDEEDDDDATEDAVVQDKDIAASFLAPTLGKAGPPRRQLNWAREFLQASTPALESLTASDDNVGKSLCDRLEQHGIARVACEPTRYVRNNTTGSTTVLTMRSIQTGSGSNATWCMMLESEFAKQFGSNVIQQLPLHMVCEPPSQLLPSSE
jgi:hypothetical protein